MPCRNGDDKLALILVRNYTSTNGLFQKQKQSLSLLTYRYAKRARQFVCAIADEHTHFLMGEWQMNNDSDSNQHCYVDSLASS